MIRIPTMLGLALLTTGLVAGVVLVQRTQRINPRAAESSPPPENITISNVNDRSFTVSWTTATPTSGFLQVGNTGQPLTRRVGDDRDKNVTSPELYSTHYVTVDALAAGSAYQFRLGEETSSLFDQQGQPFSVTTALALEANQITDLAQGTVATRVGFPAGGVVVYAQLPGAQLVSALVSATGNWIIPLSTTRTSSLSAWATYDPATTAYALRVEGGPDGRSDVTLTTASDNPAPPIVLGETYDFRQSKDPVAPKPTLELQGGTTPEPSGPAGTEGPESLFEFPSLGPVTRASEGVTLDNPKQNGEVVGTDKPEFFGKGPAGAYVEVTINSSQTISANVEVPSNGVWTFAVPSTLASGAHEITIKWTDEQGILQTLTRSFVVSASEGAAFTSTPSATPTVRVGSGLTLTPTKIPTPTPTVPPRSSVPTGTPLQSGSLTPSAVLFMIGSLCTVAGVLLVRRGETYGR